MSMPRRILSDTVPPRHATAPFLYQRARLLVKVAPEALPRCTPNMMLVAIVAASLQAKPET
ncbi:hypothetical protein E4U41_005672, partial [Claviceps citrina]